MLIALQSVLLSVKVQSTTSNWLGWTLTGDGHSLPPPCSRLAKGGDGGLAGWLCGGRIRKTAIGFTARLPAPCSQHQFLNPWRSRCSRDRAFSGNGGGRQRDSNRPVVGAVGDGLESPAALMRITMP
jgi:hypothetical protein